LACSVYEITGSWDNPVIEEIKQIEQIEQIEEEDTDEE